MFKLTTLALAAALTAPLAMASTATVAPASAQAGQLASNIDTLLTARYKAEAPGAVVIVVQDGKTVLRKAYGMADVASKTPMQPDMVLRLGSITKQFTAVAIMQLVEQGKLKVSDPLTRFFPDYPGGEKITVEHLLTHTSGIPSYTSKPDFAELAAKNPTVAQVIDSFKNDKLEFAPGSTYRYNNSGYFLLGAIIEKLSGQSYAQYMAEHIFKPLGMQHTAYEGVERTAGKRATGHTMVQGKVADAGDLNTTMPYAAGALVSTVDDLARWNAAIDSGKILSRALWRKMFTPYTLSSGEKSTYAYGWAVDKLQGAPSIEHDGAITGFRSYAGRFPEQKLFVAVLHNADSGAGHPTAAGHRIAALALGKPLIDYKPVPVEAREVELVAGQYTHGADKINFFPQHGALVVQAATGQAANLKAFKPDGYFMPGKQWQVEFVREGGKVVRAIITADGTAQTYARTGEAVRPVEVKIPAAEFDKLVGTYPLAPSFSLTVTRDGERYFVQGTGQPALEVFADSATVFRARDVAAELHFGKDDKGEPTITLLQNGQKISASRAAAVAPRPTISISPAEFDKLVGRYPLAPGFDLTVSRKDDRYFVQGTGQQPIEVFAESATVFFARDVAAELHFGVDAKGAPTITLVQNGQRTSASRAQ